MFFHSSAAKANFDKRSKMGRYDFGNCFAGNQHRENIFSRDLLTLGFFGKGSAFVSVLFLHFCNLCMDLLDL